jgi:hypothetical protein
MMVELYAALKRRFSTVTSFSAIARAARMGGKNAEICN